MSSYTYKAQCYVCGFNYKAFELKKRWDGKMVCPKDWEPRNILDFYKPRNDTHKLPWTQPEADQSGHEFTTYTPTISDTPTGGSYTFDASYTFDTTTKQYTTSIILIPTTPTTNPPVLLPFSLFSAPFLGYNVATDQKGTCIGATTGRLYSIMSCTGIGGPTAYMATASGNIVVNEKLLIRVKGILI